ncbi:Protein of unknown function [Streptomyces sp. Ag82_O1-12]|uniref:DUF2510 domain-containing protein n=1 Tax=unclassified Streptomyces TaxID=2593676 RepID=UPI000BDD7C82|nr:MULTISPECIES: DUF2510 domain-containing protein [unclassified Streptomyces]SMQ15129.1 Protein of unknown function [Streptomyces sp. Ag82_O1-12]SOD44157.1 Protein of unknown function [Streptomyces sp. Ag82_G6-1]
MTPPPGWYPDPHAPHRQRWWDGTAWTEHRRAPEGPAAPPPGGGTGRTKAVALTATAVVLVAAIVTGAVALGGGDGDGTRTRTAPTTPAHTPDSPEPTPEASTSAPSADDPKVVEDQLNGITFPLLDGWVRPQYVAQDDVVMTTDGTYDCPGGVGLCRHGMVFSRTVTENDEKSPEALAKADISEAADEAYDRDSLGRELHGGMKAHQVVKSGPVAVAGRAGYLVRWRVTTAKGPGGYVQSLVFPSSVGTESPVLVRYVFDAGADGPPLADMDRVTKGIRPFGDADTGGGVGSSIGPTD